MTPEVHLLLQGEHDHDTPCCAGMSMVIEPLTSSVTLIRGESITLVDAGSPPYADRLLHNLREQGLSPGDVEYLLLTHLHLDHTQNSVLFRNAKIISEPNVQLVGMSRCEVFEQPIEHPDWTIFSTNGHMPMHFSVFVDGTWRGEKQNIVVAGDAVRKDLVVSGYYNSDRAKPGERDSARRIFERAEVILPGHFEPIEGSTLLQYRQML